MADLIITPNLGKLEFIDNSTQVIRRHSFTLDAGNGIILDAPFSASSVTAPLNVINVTAGSSNVNYPFIFANSGETGAKSLLMDSAGGTYNPSTNTATIDISGNSATTTLASNSTNLGGVAAASYVTLTGTQTLTNKTITGSLFGTSSWATNALNANTATNATQLNGQVASYYTNIPARLGYTPVNQAGDTITGNLTVNGNFAVNGSITAFSASNIYITSSNLTVTDNILLMNALSPYQRYAGIQMYDSGSNTLSQFLWDGEGDYFFLTGSSVNGKIITGPDGQTNLSSNYIPKATAGYKLGNSLIYDNGTNVGIGTTTPSGKLSTGATSGMKLLVYDNAATGVYTGLGQDLAAGNSTDLFAHSVSNLGFITFGKIGTNGTTYTEWARFNTSGNLGIGTTVPSAQLHINSTTAGATLLRTDGTNGTLFSVVDDLSDSLMSVNNSAGLPVLEVFADDRVVIGQYGQNDVVVKNNYVGIGTNNPIAKLHVTSSTSIPSAVFMGGNVGIGTTSPLAKLSVGNGSFSDSNLPVQISTAAASGTAYFGANKNGAYGALFGFDNAGYAGVVVRNVVSAGASGDAISFVVNNTTTAVYIKSDGNVGIGTTIPTTPLHVVGVISGSSFSGAGTGLTGTAANLTAGTVTTNANLTGDVTSVGNATTIANDAVTTVKILNANVTNAKLTNSSVTIGSTAVSLGATATTIAGLTSVTSTTFVGSLTGTATTASYANALNPANQYTVGGITGSLFGTSSWATNAVSANNVNNATLTIGAGTGISLSATPTFTANASVDKTITVTNSAPNETHTGDVTGATTLTIAANAVTTTKIADAAVTNVKLANSSVTIGSTAVSLGATATTIVGLSSVTSTTFVGSLTGTATTASYANALNTANQYTVSGITGSLFGTSSWATNAVTALNGGVTSISAGIGIGTSASTGAVTITNSSPNATHTGDVTGATALTIANDAVTTVKILNANVTNAKLANSSITIGSTAISLGGTTTLLPGLTSITSTTVNATTVNTTNISASATGSFGIVGINTTSPAYKLDVNGSFRTTAGSLTLFNDYIYVSPTNANTLNTAYNVNGIADMWINFRGYNDLQTQFRNLNVGDGKGVNVAWFDGTNKRLSINNGQTANYTLDVNGNFRVTSYVQSDLGWFRTDDNNGMEVLTTTNSAQAINVKGILIGSSYDTIAPQNEIRTSNNQSLVLNARGTGQIDLYTNDSTKVTVLNSGNVGIGTTAPGQKLDVEGRIRTRGATGTGGFEISAATTGTAKWRIEWDSASDSLDFNWVG